MTTSEFVSTAALSGKILAPEAVGKIVGFIEPDDDIYYAFFGAMVLAALSSDAAEYAERSLDAFRGDMDSLDLAHLRSLAGLAAISRSGRAAANAEILETLAEFAAADGGFHHTNRRAPESTPYGAFLAVALAADLDAPDAAPAEKMADVLGKKHAAGAEFRLATDAAAFLSTLAKAGRADSDAAEAAAAFLETLSRPDGGFAANPAVGFSDTLSTSSALYALRAAGRGEGKPRGGVEGFVESVWDENSGGFAAVPDARPDSEHTFHALLALGRISRKIVTTRVGQ